MVIERMCSWCHNLTREKFCPHCGHRVDVPRMECDCSQCRIDVERSVSHGTKNRPDNNPS